jgi:4-hydroxy-tetrahydrodipicolinate reductase
LRLAGVISPHESGATHRLIQDVNLKNVDAIIDFSNSKALVGLLEEVAAHNPAIRLVVGTSGWNEQREWVMQLVQQKHLYLLYGANFSVATALFARLVREASQLASRFEFDPAIWEIHHRHKVDMPSSTAKALAEIVLSEFPRKQKCLYGMANREIAPEELHVSSLRQGENLGFHEVIFDSPTDVIRLSEQTLDRRTYASGAILALKWFMQQTEAGYYTFDRVIEEVMKT